MPMNAQQLEAVHHINGPCCVTAGAGAGKTTVLTKRIQYLIEQGISPKNILSITFTKKAATEMKERLIKLVGEQGEDVFLGTFHSFGLRVLYFKSQWEGSGVLKKEKKERPQILSEQDKLGLICDLVQPDSIHMKKPIKSTIEPEVAASFISWQKNNLLFPIDELDFSCLEDSEELSDVEKSDYKKVYIAFEREKRKANIIDFDDMLTETYLALKNNADFRNYYINKYKYILVDEFQDTNVAQYELVKLLAGYTKNVFIVGDARQAIYSWRCSNVQFILDFPKNWANTHLISLDDNYRSTVEVVDLSTKLIKHATINYPGNCRSGLNKHGDSIYSILTDDAQDEADIVAQLIYDFVKFQHRVRWSDVAILYRLNAQSVLFENACIALDIPYVVAGATDFYDIREIKECLEYLRAVVNPNDLNIFKNILQIPARNINSDATSRIASLIRDNEGLSVTDAIKQIWSTDDNVTPEISDDKDTEQNPTANELLLLADIIEQARKMEENEERNVGDIISMIAKRTGYYKFIIERKKNKAKDDDGSVASLVDSFIKSCSPFKKIQELFDYIERAKDKKNDDNSSKVQMMSLHRSKGLEFKMVFVVGMNEGVLPHSKSIQYDRNDNIIPESIEEERRLCYVGITRAKELLFLTAHKDINESPFFKELEPYTENLDDYYQEVKKEWRNK